jgi:hypothetical protein
MAKKISATDIKTPFINGFTYDDAFSGDGWELVKGKDFTLAPTTVVVKIREEFARRFGELLIEVEGDYVRVSVTLPSSAR